MPLEIVRLVAALPLTLFLPGYAIIAAAFGSRELAPPKRLMLSVAISLMVLALGAFVLNIFPFGLDDGELGGAAAAGRDRRLPRRGPAA